MASEIQFRASLQIRVGQQDYRSSPTSFTDDVSSAADAGIGPTPGRITVSTMGTDVDLSELTTPGYVWMHNTDSDNACDWGIYDPEQDRFYPVGRLGPGQFCQFFLSPLFGQEYYPATGTGTTGPTNTLRLRAQTASVVMRVDAFEA